MLENQVTELKLNYKALQMNLSTAEKEKAALTKVIEAEKNKQK
jgi:hypothetical protein